MAASFNLNSKKEDISMKLKASNGKLTRDTTDQLAQDTTQMNARLQELKIAMNREKEQRERTQGPFWRAGVNGPLGSSYAVDFVNKNTLIKTRSAKDSALRKERITVLKDEPIVIPERPSALTRPGVVSSRPQRPPGGVGGVPGSEVAPGGRVGLGGGAAAVTAGAGRLLRDKGSRCGQCEERTAQVTCVECGEDYCAHCFAAFHIKGALRKHRSIPVGTGHIRTARGNSTPRSEVVNGTDSQPVPAALLNGGLHQSSTATRIEHSISTPSLSAGDSLSSTKTAVVQAPSTQSLLEGAYNEADSAEAFQLALQAWRRGGGGGEGGEGEGGKKGGKTGVVRQQHNEIGVSTSISSRTSARGPMPEINFTTTSDLTYAEKLLLKKLRRQFGTETPAPDSSLTSRTTPQPSTERDGKDGRSDIPGSSRSSVVRKSATRSSSSRLTSSQINIGAGGSLQDNKENRSSLARSSSTSLTQQDGSSSERELNNNNSSRPESSLSIVELTEPLSALEARNVERSSVYSVTEMLENGQILVTTPRPNKNSSKSTILDPSSRLRSPLSRPGVSTSSQGATPLFNPQPPPLRPGHRTPSEGPLYSPSGRLLRKSTEDLHSRTNSASVSKLKTSSNLDISINGSSSLQQQVKGASDSKTKQSSGLIDSSLKTSAVVKPTTQKNVRKSLEDLTSIDRIRASRAIDCRTVATIMEKRPRSKYTTDNQPATTATNTVRTSVDSRGATEKSARTSARVAKTNIEPQFDEPLTSGGVPAVAARGVGSKQNLKKSAMSASLSTLERSGMDESQADMTESLVLTGHRTGQMKKSARAEGRGGEGSERVGAEVGLVGGGVLKQPMSQRSNPSSRPASARKLYSDGILTKPPSDALLSVSRLITPRLPGVDTSDIYTIQDLGSYFTLGVKQPVTTATSATPRASRITTPRTRPSTPGEAHPSGRTKLSNKLYQLGPRSWRPESSLVGANGDTREQQQIARPVTTESSTQQKTGEVKSVNDSVVIPSGNEDWSTTAPSEKKLRSVGAAAVVEREMDFNRGAAGRVTPNLMIPRDMMSLRRSVTGDVIGGALTSRSVSRMSEMGEIGGGCNSPRPMSGRQSQMIVVDGDDLSVYDDLEEREERELADNEEIGRLETELSTTAHQHEEKRSEAGPMETDKTEAEQDELTNRALKNRTLTSPSSSSRLLQQKNSFDINNRLRESQLMYDFDEMEARLGEEVEEEEDEKDEKDVTALR